MGIIVIVVIIIVIDEAELVFHVGGIIAQFAAITINFENPIHHPKLEMHFKKIYS